MKRTLLLSCAFAALAGLSPARAQVVDLSGIAAPLDQTLSPIGIDASEAVLVAATGFVPSAAAAAPAAGGYTSAAFRASSGNGYTPAADASGTDTQAADASAAGQGNGRLSDEVLKKAFSVAGDINKTGGYRFDGTNDCYGFVRRVWDPILSAMGHAKLPVSDYPSSQWARITDWNKLHPGDALATAQGHFWGAHWHGGLFKGMKNGTPMIFDNTPSHNGASVHSNEVFTYYYIPTHQLLEKN